MNMLDYRGQQQARIKARMEQRRLFLSGSSRAIDRLHLMEIARKLPRFEMPETTWYDDDAGKRYDGDVAALSIYAEMLEALQAFIRTNRLMKARPKFGTVRKNLKRLGDALTELAAAWDGADYRTKNLLYQSMGQPLTDGIVAQPIMPLESDDEPTRGLYRITKVIEGAAMLAAMVGATKNKIAPEPGRKDHPGLDELVRCLADIFEGQGHSFTTSRNRGNATDFVESVVAALPKELWADVELRPASGSIIPAVWQVSQQRRAKKAG
jgi:hypothetical protein